MRLSCILGLAALLVVGCSKGSTESPQTDSSAMKAPAASGTTDTPASGQPQAAPPIATPPAVAATVPSATTATQPAVPGKPVATAASAAPAATAPATGANGVYTFKYAPKEGVVDYKITTSMDMGNGQPMDMNTTMTNKISKNKDGTYTVINTTTAPQGFGNAAPMTVTSVIDSKGRLVSGGAKSTGTSVNPLGSSSFSNTLPDHPVKIGDTWSFSDAGKSKTSMLCKLVKVDNKGGAQMATVEIVKMSTAGGGMTTVKLTKPGQLHVDVATGVLSSADMDVELSLHMPASTGGSAPTGIPKGIKVHMKMVKQ